MKSKVKVSRIEANAWFIITDGLWCILAFLCFVYELFSLFQAAQSSRPRDALTRTCWCSGSAWHTRSVLLTALLCLMTHFCQAMWSGNRSTTALTSSVLDPDILRIPCANRIFRHSLTRWRILYCFIGLRLPVEAVVTCGGLWQIQSMLLQVVSRGFYCCLPIVIKAVQYSW